MKTYRIDLGDQQLWIKGKDYKDALRRNGFMPSEVVQYWEVVG